MNNLPYLQPKKELFLNLSILLLIINKLGLTVKGKKNLSFDKIRIFYFLINNPIILNKFLYLSGKELLEVDELDCYTVDSISINVDDLYDVEKIKILIKIVTLKGYVSVDLNKDDGFVFYLNQDGSSIVSKLETEYFNKINKFIDAILFLRSFSLSKINSLVNSAIE